MPRLTISKAYERVNDAWPETVPPLTADEAMKAAKRLYRYAMGETWKHGVMVTSGNRYSGFGREVSDYDRTVGRPAIVVNPDDGWKRFVHLLSHAFYWRANPHERPHSKDHARLERKMIEQVVRRGWLDGRLRTPEKPKPTKQEKREGRLAALDRRIEAWERKAKRANNALKKLHAKRAAIHRAFMYDRSGKTLEQVAEDEERRAA